MPALTQILYSLPIAFIVLIVVSMMTQPADEKIVAYIEKVHSEEA